MNNSKQNSTGFLNRVLTEEEWNNPDFMKFSNAEIPANDVVFGNRLEELVEKYTTPSIISKEGS